MHDFLFYYCVELSFVVLFCFDYIGKSLIWEGGVFLKSFWANWSPKLALLAGVYRNREKLKMTNLTHFHKRGLSEMNVEGFFEHSYFGNWFTKSGISSIFPIEWLKLFDWLDLARKVPTSNDPAILKFSNTNSTIKINISVSVSTTSAHPKSLFTPQQCGQIECQWFFHFFRSDLIDNKKKHIRWWAQSQSNSIV